jgi:hypothetical protein
MRGAERPGRPNRSGPARRHSPDTHLCPKLYAPSGRYLTQHNSILSSCCADHTHSVSPYCARAGTTSAKSRRTNCGAQTPRNPDRASSAPLLMRARLLSDCQRMMAHAPNPRLQAILTDMGRTWTRLALEAEQILKESRPPLQLIVPNRRAPT